MLGDDLLANQPRICVDCGGSGQGSAGGILVGGARWSQICEACDGRGRFDSADPDDIPFARYRKRAEDRRVLDEAARQQQEAEEQRRAAEKSARLADLLAPPARGSGWWVRLHSSKKRLTVNDIQRLPDLERRARLLRDELVLNTNDRLKSHLDVLRSKLHGSKPERGYAVAELAELDARAIPMLVDLCFFDAEAPEKAKRSAYKAIGRIRDDVAVSYLACHLRDWELGKDISQLMAMVI